MSNAQTKTPDASATPAPAGRTTRIVGVIVGVPLIVFLGLEGMSLLAAQQTEGLRREVGIAGGTCKFEKRVPGWLQTLAGEDFHTFMDYPVIVEIEMTGDEYGDLNLAKFPMLDDLRKLVLHDTRISSDSLQYIAKWKNLRHLDLTNTQVTDVTPLAELPHLEILQINFSQVRGEHVAGLPQLEQLKELSAGYIQVTDAEVVEIAKCTGLKELSIAASDLGERGLQPLASLQNLDLLVLRDAKFDPADLQALQESRPDLEVFK